MHQTPNRTSATPAQPTLGYFASWGHVVSDDLVRATPAAGVRHPCARPCVRMCTPAVASAHELQRVSQLTAQHFRGEHALLLPDFAACDWH